MGSKTGHRPITQRLLCYGLRFSETKSILFGGTMYDVKMFNDPWEQDPTGWTQVVDTGPSPRSRHSMVYDENRKKIVLFGGYSEGPVIDTWQLEDNVWKKKQDIGPSYPVSPERRNSSLRRDNYSPGGAGGERRVY